MDLEDQGARRPERGATAVEYGLFIALIAGAIIAIVVVLGPQVASLYTSATQGW
jgi:pilus assembly protein Flp/PilA